MQIAQTTDVVDPEYIDLKGAVIKLGGVVRLATLRGWIYTGKLPAYKPGRQVLVRMRDVYAMIESHPHRSSAYLFRRGAR